MWLHMTKANRYLDYSCVSTKKEAIVFCGFFSPSFLSLTGHEIPIKMQYGVIDLAHVGIYDVK